MCSGAWVGVQTACRPDDLRVRATLGGVRCIPDDLGVHNALKGPHPVRETGAHPERDSPQRAVGSTDSRRRRGDEAPRGESEGERGQQHEQKRAPFDVVARGARASERVHVLRGGGERGLAGGFQHGYGAWLAGGARCRAEQDGGCRLPRLLLRALCAVDPRQASPLAARRCAAAATRDIVAVRIGAPGSAGRGEARSKREGCVGLAGSRRR